MPQRLKISRAVLLVVDMQKAFASAIPDFAEIARRTGVIIQGCKVLGIPIIATEQVPAKLGATVEPVRNALGDIRPLEKTAFSACAAEGFIQQLSSRDQVLLCGIETHICINQTSHDLLALNCQVNLLIDAIGSRFAHDHEAGRLKMFAAGVIPSSIEMALFELMGDAHHEHFRTIQKLIK